jgi:excisionase family DNA binding protein
MDTKEQQGRAEPAALLLKPAEAAKLLQIGDRTLWRLTDEGEIPCIRIGRSVRYDPADLRVWIAAKKNPPRLDACRCPSDGANAGLQPTAGD